MNDPNPSTQAASEPPAGTGGRKRYETPRLVDYGHISRLTQTGGATSKDQGNRERAGK